MTTTRAVQSGLTTTKAPFIEKAQREGQLYIHQPYELYSEENHEAWRRLYRRMIPRWHRFAISRFIEGIGALLSIPGAEIPAGGFLTTLGDLVRFVEMLRGGGDLDGARILSPAMLEFATRNWTGDKPNALLDYTVQMRGWAPFPASIGLGFFVRGEGIIPGPFGNLSSPRTFGGIGAGSTAFWIDPARDLGFCFLSTGIMEDSFHLERVSRLSDAVIAALVH